MTSRPQPRSSLASHASLMRDAQPLTSSDRRRWFSTAWHEHGDDWVVFQRSDVPSLLWDVLAKWAAKIYGQRRT